MSNKVMVIGGASLLAILLLAATFLFQPASTHNAGPQTPPTLDPNQLPPGMQPRKVDDDPLAGAGPIRQYVVEFMNKRKQLIQIRGQSFTPQPHGRAHVGQPLTRIHLKPNQVVQIQAPQGTFIAPENQPRSGELLGSPGQQVVLSYFQSPPDQTINYQPDSPHLLLRILLDEVKFDLELGTVDSDGPIHASSPRFEFQGKGLSLSFNELRRRLDRLEIFQGKILRVQNSTPGTGTPPGAGTPGNNSPSPAGGGGREGAAAGVSKVQSPMPNVLGDAPDISPGATDQPIQQSTDENQPTHYQARFLQNVKVQNPEMTLLGDELHALFSMDRQQMRQDPLAPPGTGTPGSSPGSSAVPSPAGGGGREGAAPASSSGGGKSPSETESLFVPSADDLVITWTGRLTVEPQAQPAPELANPQDVLVRLVGQPVRVTTARQEKITASFAQYLLSSASLTLVGTQRDPVQMDSPELGILQSPKVFIDQSKATGTLTGPGMLKGRMQSSPAATSPNASSALPADLTVQWQDRLDVTFYTQRQGHNRSNQANQRLRALKSVDFAGQVKVDHQDMDLSADRLVMALDDPQTGKQSVQQIDATGKVVVNTRATDQQPALAIRSDQLRLELEPQADQRLRPTRMIAKGQVDTASQGRRIRAGEMIVGFNSMPKTSSDQQPQIRIATLDATDHVRIELEEPPTQLQGQRVQADLTADTLVLTGSKDQPARMQQPDGSLVGPRIVMQQQSQTVRVEGPGEFDFLERSSDKPTADPAHVHVKWTKSMGFDNRLGMARFVENVQVNGKTRRDTTTLLAQDLSLNFHPTPAPGNANIKSSSRRIKDMLAKDRVVFESQNWVDKPQGTLASRFRLEGDNLAFDNASQTVRVLGPGRMFYQDTQPAPVKPQPQPAQASSIVFADSKGATVFTWVGKLLFDAGENQMVIQDKVEMIHQSARDNQLMQLNCDNFVASLEKTGGIDAWTSGSAPTPKLHSVTALDHVGIQSGNRTIRTDHLLYDAGQQSLSLRANPGKLTEVWEKGDTKPHTAQQLRWDLAKNRLEIINPGPGRIPAK